MNDMKIIDLTPENIVDYGVCGYKDVNRHPELRKKFEWFNTYYNTEILACSLRIDQNTHLH